MSKPSQIGLAVVVVGTVLISAVTAAFLSPSRQAPTATYKVAALPEVHVTAGAPVVLNDPDSSKRYVVDAGGKLTLTRPQRNPERIGTLVIEVKSGGELTAEGTNIQVTADPGSKATVGDGVFINGVGGVIHAHGTARVKAMSGTLVFNNGTGDEHAYAGSITYARVRGRVFAHSGSIVYIKSPDNCDDCTQAQADPGSIIYVYEGAEAFATQATVTVYKGGDAGCYHGCTLNIFPDADYNKACPDCAMNMMAADSPVLPFKEEE
jgi:hypothetical protein